MREGLQSVAEGGSLTGTTLRGVAWSWGATAATLLLQLIYTAVMARLLQPADFGLLAAALVGMRFVTYFSTLGLASAVIQRPNLTRRDSSTAFWLAVLLGLAALTGIIVASPLLAAVVETPEVEPVVRWLSVAVFVSSLAMIPEALLRRSMRFRALAGVQVVSFAVGYLGVGVFGALSGWGVWSLVAAQIGQGLVHAVLVTALAPPPLSSGFSVSSARGLASFGGTVSLTGFLEFLSGSMDTLAVGRYAGSASLGQYSKATQLVGLPLEQSATATSKVLLPSFSRVQDDGRRFGEALQTAVALSTVGAFAVAAMISAASPAVVSLLLGPGWEEAAFLLPIVAVAYTLSMLTHFPAVAAEARGEVFRKLVIQAITVAATVGLLATAVLAGPTPANIGAAWAGGELLRHILYWALILPRLALDRRVIAKIYFSAALAATAAALPLFIGIRTLDMQGFLPLAFLGSVGAMAGLAVVVTPLGWMIKDEYSNLRTRLPKATSS